MFVEGGWLLAAPMDDYLQKDSPKIAKEVLGHFVDGFRPILWLTTSPPNLSTVTRGAHCIREGRSCLKAQQGTQFTATSPLSQGGDAKLHNSLGEKQMRVQEPFQVETLECIINKTESYLPAGAQ